MLDLDWENSSKKNYNFSVDPLALSWACYRRVMETPGVDPFPDLRTVNATDYDFEMAELSRSYYRDKIMFKQLQSPAISKFRTDLYHLLTDKPVTSENLGMLYKIPYFYQEDTAKAALKEFFKPIKNPRNPAARDFSLTFHSKIHRFRKSDNAMEFWFFDDTKEPYMFSVARSNPLLRLVESVCKLPRVDIRAIPFCKSKHHNIDFDFYQLSQIELR